MDVVTKLERAQQENHVWVTCDVLLQAVSFCSHLVGRWRM